MANAASPVSQTSPHFFQPLLPGFQSHLKIPVKFFSKHIEGKHEGLTVNLRTDASERTRKVRMEGNRLTDGWKEFVVAHDFRVGDFLVFRHEGDMLFHVTALGPSFCEIQFAQSRSHEKDEESDEIDSRSEKEVDENVKTESDQSLSDLNCFSQSVTASNLSRDRVVVPIGFAKRNGLNKEQVIVLMNEEGKSWASEVKSWGTCRIFIVRGWTSFCTANKLEVGDSCSFRLLQNTETPVFQLCSRTKAERKNKILSAKDCINDRPGVNRFVKLTLTSGSLHHGKQHLPVNFTRENGLINPGKIILVDKNRAEWSMKLKVDKRSGMLYIISCNGWKSFCAANEVGAGESLILELIRGGVSPLLKFSSKMEQPPDEAEAQAHKRARVQRWIEETGPKLETREKIAEEGEPSRASNKSSGNKGNLQHTQPCFVSDQVTKVKQSVVDTLTSIRRLRAELETMELKIEDSLQEISNLERGEDNGNKTTSSSKPGATRVKGPVTSEKQSTLSLPTEDASPKNLNLSANMYTALRELRAALVKEAPDGVMSYHIFTVKVSMYGDRLLETIESTVNEYYGTNKKDSIISKDCPDSGKRGRDENISPTSVAE